MGLADLLADRDDDALPTDHGAKPEGEGDRRLDPDRDEVGDAVDRVGCCLGTLFRIRGVELVILGQLRHDRGEEIQIRAQDATLLLGDLPDLGNVLDHREGIRGNRADGGKKLGRGLVGALQEPANDFRGITRDQSLICSGGMGGAVGHGILHFLAQRLQLTNGAVLLESVSGGKDAHQDEHDETHALLAVIGSVGKAHAGAGEHQQGPDPSRRRVTGIWRCVEAGILDKNSHHDQEEGRQAESDDR